MSSQNTNGAAVPIRYIPTSGPTPGGSIADDPPPYSECVPYPPPISNCPKTNSSLPANPPEEYPLNRIQHPEVQTGTYRHDAIPSAPLLDVSATLPPSYPNVFNPTITPNVVDLSSSNDSTQTNVPIHIHSTKILVPHINPRHAGSQGKSLKMCVSGVFGIVAFFIIVAVILLRYHIRNRRMENMKVINKLDDINIDLDESYGKEISRIFNNNNDIFKDINMREDGYDKFLKTSKDRNQNDDDDFDDYIKKIVNDFRKRSNMLTLPSNMTFNEMYKDTMNNFFKTDLTFNRFDKSTKPIGIPEQISISNDNA